MKLFYTSIILFFATLSLQAQSVSITEIWRTSDILPTPESVLFVPERQELFVSLIDGDGNAKDGQGGVAILNLDGTIKDATWVTGLNAPKGMALYKELLYIADITTVVVVDIVSGNVIDEIEIPGSVFLNDVTADAAGVVYVSDTRLNKVYRIRNGRHEVYLEDVASANGLKSVGEDLYVLAAKELWKVDANKKITIVGSGLEENGDGIEPVGNGDFLITCWPGLVYYMHANGPLTELLDVRGKMSTADLGYHPEKKVLYIPTFGSNSVVAYSLR